MKTLKKIKLNQLGKAELEKREINALKGGCDPGGGGSCVCVCWGVSVIKRHVVTVFINGFVHLHPIMK
jgi:natural product precursor